MYQVSRQKFALLKQGFDLSIGYELFQLRLRKYNPTHVDICFHSFWTRVRLPPSPDFRTKRKTSFRGLFVLSRFEGEGENPPICGLREGAEAGAHLTSFVKVPSNRRIAV